MRKHLVYGPILFTLLAAALLGQPAAAQPSAPPPAATGLPQRVIYGTIVSSAGPVVGGSVRLVDGGQVCVTNSDGEFYFQLTAPVSQQAAVITYHGANDAQVVLVAGKQPTPIEVPAPQLDRAGAKALRKAVKYGQRQGRKEARKAN